MAKVEPKRIIELAEEMATDVAVKINEINFTKKAIKAVKYPRQLLLEEIIKQLEKKV